MKFEVFVGCLALFFTVFKLASAQNWEYRGSFPNNDFMGGSGCYGLAVDPEGKVWIQLFGETDSILSGSVKLATRVIYIFNRDGSPAPFSPIKRIIGPGIDDSMASPPGYSNRGLRTDHAGNILAASFDRLFRINYQTGTAMNKQVPSANNTLTAPAVDSMGNIFTACVLPGLPIQIFEKDNLSLIGYAVDSSKGYSRSFEVSRDGNTIYWAGYTNHAVYRYTRKDEFSAFPLVPDTILKGMDAESFCWNPKTRYLWLSSGNYSDLPNRYPDTQTYWQPNTWYAYNPIQDKITDSLSWQFNIPNNLNERPRAIAFSLSGDTAYVGCYGGSDYSPVQMFVKKTSGLKQNTRQNHNSVSPLLWNYPNPFNPSTTMQYSLLVKGQVTVEILNVRGEKVQTLVSGFQEAGRYKTVWDGKDQQGKLLSSGIYTIYLKSGDYRERKQMLLVK